MPLTGAWPSWRRVGRGAGRRHKAAGVGALRERSRSLELIWQGMAVYLAKTPAGKKFHDPLAACCAIDERVGTWAEVELYRERGEWGARLAPGSSTRIITGHDPERFLEVLLRT